MRSLALLAIPFFAGGALAQGPQFPPAPLDDIAAAIEARNVRYFDQQIAFILTTDGTRITGDDLLKAIAGCSVAQKKEDHFGLATISLDCPGRVASSTCFSSDQRLVVLARRNGTFAIEIGEVKSSANGCASLPPRGQL